MSEQSQLSLRAWIKGVGPDKISKTMNVSRATVCHWMRGYVLPRSPQMLEIMRLSKGALTPTSMVVDHFKKSNKMRFSDRKK